MSRTNTKTRSSLTRTVTNEGAPAHLDRPLKELRRAVLGCMLFEDQFYESGVDIATRIGNLSEKVTPHELAALAVEARQTFNLRHVPLLLLVKLAKVGSGIPYLVQDTVYTVISRADEIAELVALYWKVNGQTVDLPTKRDFRGRFVKAPVVSQKKTRPLPAQFKKGLARAITKFDAYQLAKYDRDYTVKLRDVVFLTHPNPNYGRAGVKTVAQLVNKSYYPEKNNLNEFGQFEKLTSPDTWEVALSAGADKKETFTRLLQEGKLGYLALLRNLRNMDQAGVDDNLIRQAILDRKGAERVFPFRYIAAARVVPRMEPWLDEALLAAIDDMPKFPGKTVILVDVSGSMDWTMSGKSDLKRMDAAAALASIFPSDNLRVFSFANSTKEVPPRRGMAGVEAVINSQSHGGTDLGGAVQHAINLGYDRLVVLTDEQSHTRVPHPKEGINYMINVGSYRESVAYDGDWIRIEGFADAIIKYMAEYENFLAE